MKEKMKEVLYQAAGASGMLILLMGVTWGILMLTHTLTSNI